MPKFLDVETRFGDVDGRVDGNTIIKLKWDLLYGNRH
jgi:hypothetical protein